VEAVGKIAARVQRQHDALPRINGLRRQGHSQSFASLVEAVGKIAARIQRQHDALPRINGLRRFTKARSPFPSDKSGGWGCALLCCLSLI
jgi:hypothetical protein